ncbi:hypothetical protein T440DRAFT_483013 [Plenodomus tracheiphilus IPT5]|uniref:Zn(2)-C6 fungal-type domain-containing protein n=1 Tax=Plenodomus tracheiphilus IPT5 TaxID=1408161 RepID=A0A6A7AR98_9PLEO|nr:hypothetical protein T440DRAFT_483013 [Plenodomus tracheiphilus IPT5]
MVSRGGRSRGCAWCRKRRVKCDEQRPTCGQCSKRKLTCDGPKDLTWIHHASGTPTTISIPSQPSYAGFEQDICLAFTRKTLLRGGPVELACEMIDYSPQSSRFENPGLALLRKAIISLAVTFFGNQHHQETIKAKGYNQYGQVLCQLNSHLSLPELQTTNETLLTSLACMLLEVFLPTGPRNFLKHLRGIEAMMKMRGPPLETTGQEATIFRGLRILSIVGALAEARPSLYTETEWRTAPPPLHMTEAGVLQYRIFGILAECTRLLGLRDEALTPYPQPDKLAALDREVILVLHNLEAIKTALDTFNQRLINEAESLSPLAIELGVANHTSATPYMLYNTAYLCILQLQNSLHPSPTYIALRNAAAAKIARCMELRQYELMIHALESNTIAFVATKIAWQTLGRFESPEGLRLATMVGKAVDGVFMQPARSIKEMEAHEEQSTDNRLAETTTSDTKTAVVQGPGDAIVSKDETMASWDSAFYLC